MFVVFFPTTEVITFSFRVWCMPGALFDAGIPGCIFVADIHPSRTRMWWSFESMQWAHRVVHRLYSILPSKECGVRTCLTSKNKFREPDGPEEGRTSDRDLHHCQIFCLTQHHLSCLNAFVSSDKSTYLTPLITCVGLWWPQLVIMILCIYRYSCSCCNGSSQTWSTVQPLPFLNLHHEYRCSGTGIPIKYCREEEQTLGRKTRTSGWFVIGASWWCKTSMVYNLHVGEHVIVLGGLFRCCHRRCCCSCYCWWWWWWLCMLVWIVDCFVFAFIIHVCSCLWVDAQPCVCMWLVGWG